MTAPFSPSWGAPCAAYSGTQTLDQYRHCIRHGKAATPTLADPLGHLRSYPRDPGIEAMNIDPTLLAVSTVPELDAIPLMAPQVAFDTGLVAPAPNDPTTLPIPMFDTASTPINASYQPIMDDSHTESRSARNRAIAEDLVRQETQQKAHQTAAETSKKDSLPSYPGLTERYLLRTKMGDGAFSNVYHAHHRSTGQECAIKVVRKAETKGSAHLHAQFRKKFKPTERASIWKEVQIMRRLDHGNIVRLLDFSESEKYYFLVLELVRGGELFHQIAKLTYFSEDLTRHVILQVAEAIRYMHSRGVVHRDIKPENILFDPIPFIPSKISKARPYDEDKEDEGEFIPGVGGGGIGRVKIADFGLSKVLTEGSWATSPCGTIGYTAPEQIVRGDKRYSKSVDIWALGCVLYTLLCGFPPFYDESIDTLTHKVSRGDYTFLSPWWDDISLLAKDLVTHLLEVDARKRYTIEQVLAHPWCRAPQPVPSLTPGRLEIAQRMPLASPLVSALRSNDPVAAHQARAGLGLTTPGMQQLKEAFDVSCAVHRLGEEQAGQLNSVPDDDTNDTIMPDAAPPDRSMVPQQPLTVAQQQLLQQAPRVTIPSTVAGSAGSPTPSGAPAGRVPALSAGQMGFKLNLNDATLLKNRGHRRGLLQPNRI